MPVRGFGHDDRWRDIDVAEGTDSVLVRLGTIEIEQGGRLITGEEASDPCFEQLFRAYFPGMVRLAGLLGADDPENVAQEAFARLHAALPRLRDQAATVSYVRRIVVNLSRSGIRHRSTVTKWQPALVSANVEPAEDTAVRRDEARRVLAAVSALKREHREILVCRYWGRLSVEETAAALEISAGTVKSRTSRAMAALSSVLGDQP